MLHKYLPQIIIAIQSFIFVACFEKLPTEGKGSLSDTEIIIQEVQPGDINRHERYSNSQRNLFNKTTALEDFSCESCDVYLSGNASKSFNQPGQLACIKKGKKYTGSININATTEFRVCGTWDAKYPNVNGMGTLIKVSEDGLINHNSHMSINTNVKYHIKGEMKVKGNMGVNGELIVDGLVELRQSGNFSVNGQANLEVSCSGLFKGDMNNVSFQNNGNIKNEGRISFNKGHFTQNGSGALTQGPGAQLKSQKITLNSTAISGINGGCSQIKYTSKLTNNSNWSSPSNIDLHKGNNETCQISMPLNICEGDCQEIDLDAPDTYALGDSLASIDTEAMVVPVVVGGDVVHANHLVEVGEYVVVSYNTAGDVYKGALQFIKGIQTNPTIEREFHFTGMEINTVYADGDRIYIGGAAGPHDDGGSLFTYLDMDELGEEALNDHLVRLGSYGVVDITSVNGIIYLATGAEDGGLYMLTDGGQLNLSQAHSDIRVISGYGSHLYALNGSTDLQSHETPYGLTRYSSNLASSVVSQISNLEASPYSKMTMEFGIDGKIAYSLASQGVIVQSSFEDPTIEYRSSSTYGASNGLDFYKKWLFVSYSSNRIEMLEFHQETQTWEIVSHWQSSEISNKSFNSILYSNAHLFASYGSGGVAILRTPYFEKRCSIP